MQTLPLADELFLIGHDEYSGRPVVNPAVLDTGLAGAVIGELVLAGRVRVRANGTLIATDQRPYGDRVSDAALRELLRWRDPHPVRAWVEHLRGEVRLMVLPRLAHAGLIAPPSRSRPRRRTRYPATTPLKSALPRARVRYCMDHPDRRDQATALLGVLARASRMEQVFGGGAHREVRRGLDRWRAELPAELRALCDGVTAAVTAIPALRPR